MLTGRCWSVGVLMAMETGPGVKKHDVKIGTRGLASTATPAPRKERSE